MLGLHAAVVTGFTCAEVCHAVAAAWRRAISLAGLGLESAVIAGLPSEAIRDAIAAAG